MALGALVIVVFHYQGAPEALLKRCPEVAAAAPPWAWVWPQLYMGAVSAALHLGAPLGVMALGWAKLKEVPLGEPLSGARLGVMCLGLGALLTLASPVMAGLYWVLPPGEVVEGGALWAIVGVRLLRALATEVFFRGMLVLGTRQALGVSGAVGLSLIPYTMVHYHLAMQQVLAGWVTGVGLGWLAARRGSIWLGVWLHCGAVLARAAWTGGVG
jgi:membrane protease YdiL (CAAX protease family)